MILAMPVLSDAASLVTSASPATLQGENLQKMSIGEVWRSLDPENAYIQADLGTAKKINLIALLGHNGTSRAYCRVRAAATVEDLTDNPAYDSGDLPLRSHQSGFDDTWAAGVTDEEYGALDTNNFILWLGEDAQTFQFWRIDIADPLSTFFDAGRLYISNAWQPGTNMNYGLAEGFVDPSKQGRTVGGVTNSVERIKYRWCELSLSFNTKEEMFDNVFEIERARGSTKDVLLIVAPSDRNNLQRRTYYGTIKGLQPIINSNFEIYEKTFHVEEITA